MYRVKIKKLPTAQYGRSTRTGQQTATGSLAVQPTAMGGADINQYMGQKDTTVKSTLTAQPRNKSNLEAEGGETAYGDINGDGMLEHYTIKGPRHNAGGVPLNLPDDSFIYSDFVEMKIKDPDLLAKFGKSVKSKSTKGYTPADLAKQYDINKYRKLLQDPNSDTLDKKTAEIMLKNYNMKLGALALAQEGGKAFPQGIPEVAKPFMQLNGIKEEDIIPKKPQAAPTQMPSGEEIAQSEDMMQAPMAQYGMEMGGYDMPFMNSYQPGGSLQQYQKKGQVQPPYSEAEGYSPQGVERLNKYRRMYGLPQLKGSITKADIQKAAGELQSKIIDTNPELVLDYMSRTSHQPNKALLDKIPSGYAKTTEGVRQAFEEGKLSADDVRKAYKDDKWWYRALETDIKEIGKEEYETKMNEDGSITQGDKIYFQDNPDNPQLYTEYIMKDGEPVATEVVKTEEEIKGKRPDIENVDFQQNAVGATAPEWMTPDKMNYYGALRDQYSDDKSYGWSPKADLTERKGRFLDVRRAAAGVGEQANITGAGLAQFVGSPQTANVMTLASQGDASSKIADLMTQYDNANVSIGNQLENTNAGIMDQENEINRGITQQLYNQNNVTNQNYDNTYNQRLGSKRLAFATGWKGASELDAVNESSTEYDIDPSSGDSVFTGGKEISPELARDFNYYLDMYINDYGMDDDQAIKAANSAMKGTTGSYTPNFDDLLKVQKGMMVSGPMMYPFIL